MAVSDLISSEAEGWTRNLSRQILAKLNVKRRRAEETKESEAARRNSGDIDGGVSRDVERVVTKLICVIALRSILVGFEKHVKDTRKTDDSTRGRIQGENSTISRWKRYKAAGRNREGETLSCILFYRDCISLTLRSSCPST